MMVTTSITDVDSENSLTIQSHFDKESLEANNMREIEIAR